MKSTLALVLLALTGCGQTQTPSTAAAAAQTVHGKAVLRVLKHKTLSLQLTGDELFRAVFDNLSVEARTEGDDGDYYTTKKGADVTCGGSNTSPDGDLDTLEDPDCVAEFNAAGTAVELDTDPFGWADALKRSAPSPVSVTVKDGIASVYVMDEAAKLLFEGLTGAPEEHEQEDLFIRTGKSIRCTYDGSDGEDYGCELTVDKKGRLAP